MPLSRQAFRSAFNRFKGKVKRASGLPFASFQQGLPHEWESYKLPLRDRAIEILSAADWRAKDVGSGRILSKVIQGIEIKEPDGGLRNNLVRWENRYGHVNRSHHKLLDARDAAAAERVGFERLFRAFYQRREVERDAFEQFRELIGNRYDLLGYLFFILDSTRFMPIATTSFDEAFAELGLNLVTARKCSWENYGLYNEALHDVQEALVQFGGTNARLIDAHSFCWMLVRLDADGGGEVGAEVSPKKNGKRDRGRTLRPREVSITQMVQNVEATVKGALGPPIEKMAKPKELRMSRQDLKAHIEQLLVRQEDKCALTGIPFQFHGEQTDDQLLPSLDRIDSAGHYEARNLQIVCRFINFWKGASENEEFRRLLSLVRGDGE